MTFVVRYVNINPLSLYHQTWAHYMVLTGALAFTALLILCQGSRL
jgi:hypothetical protein